MKKFKITALALALLVGGVTTAAWSQDCPHASSSKADCSKGDCFRKGSQTIKEKFSKKIRMIYMYQDELGITDEQLNKIKALKISAKKSHIKKEAEIELIKVDIHALLYADKVDVAAVNKLVDKKYEVKKSLSKKCIASYAELKSILTAEQMAQLKGLHKSEKKQTACKYSSKGSKK